MTRRKTSPTVTLDVLLARDAARAVIFRRGPSRQTLLIEWDLARDAFEIGQWIKSRVHPADLSPSGRYLLCFVQGYRRSRTHQTWTALSRPPYFTALALWSLGDSWGGGGVFDTDTSVRLFHGPHPKVAPEFTLPPNFNVGELDEPPSIARKKRAGWSLLPHAPKHARDERRLTFVKPRPTLLKHASNLELRDKFGTYVLVANENETPLQASWADWDRNGDLLFAVDGKIFRAKADPKATTIDISSAIELADFGPFVFEERKAPAAALKW